MAAPPVAAAGRRSHGQDGLRRRRPHRRGRGGARRRHGALTGDQLSTRSVRRHWKRQRRILDPKRTVALINWRARTKRMGRLSAADPRTPRAERPPRQPRTLSAVGCSTGIWARTLRVDRGIDGFSGPSGAPLWRVRCWF
jgi:hypothetical protein